MRPIDADALRLMKVEECAGHTIEYAKGWKACIDWAKTLPTIDAEPVRHGRWVEETDRENHWHCSECGVVVGIVAKYAPYCYKCGARMDGGGE